MAQLNDTIYEAKPYVLLALGIYAFTAEPISMPLIVSALVLLFCGAVILRMRFKNRKGSPAETLFYEGQPFFYLGLGGYVLFYQNYSKIAVASAILLLFCAGVIFKWRYQHRR
jgi:membrane protein CcdC involved in cytochrome C biogenesis